MRISRNLLAGLANSIWSAVAGLAVVPFYLEYLGLEAYGLIGFFVTIQAVLALLDMGMAPTINREVARCSASGSLTEAGRLMHTLAVVYWSMAALIASAILVLAPLLSEYWLQSRQLSQQTTFHAVMLIGLVVACRWPVGLYQGALIGAQKLVTLSGINMAMVTAASAGAVAVLKFVSPTIEAFFIWQAAVGLAYAFTMRWAAWRVIGASSNNRFDLSALKRVWRFTAGMSGLALAGTVLTQLDKVILSKTLGLDEFGHYMLATVVVSGLSVIFVPVFNVLYPRMTALVASDEIGALTDLYRASIRAISAILFPIAMLLIVFGRDFLQIWTGSAGIASSVAPVISLLVIGSALNGVMYVPYALQLAYGVTWIPLAINLILMLFMVPLIVFLAKAYGAVGGALAWCIMEVVYIVFCPWLTHRYLIKGLWPKFFLPDVGMPLVVAILVGLLGHYVTRGEDYSPLIKLILGFVLATASLGLTFLLSPQLRSVLRNPAAGKRFRPRG
jgi:O-antigen/teichoic acid export membrane protein